MNRLPAVALLLLPFAQPARATDWAQAATTNLVWNSNLSNSDRAADRVDGWAVGADLSSTGRQSLTGDDALLLGAQLTANFPQNYADLDDVTLRPSLRWEHKFGLGAFAPVLGAQIGVEGTFAGKSARSGFGGSATLSGRWRTGPATRLAISQTLSRHDARASVFDATENETAASLSQDLGSRWQLTVNAGFRQGEVVSYAVPPRPEIAADARALAPDDTFGAPRIVYSLNAHSLSGSTALAYRAGGGLIFSLGYEHRNTRRGALDYANHLVSIGVRRTF